MQAEFSEVKVVTAIPAATTALPRHSVAGSSTKGYEMYHQGHHTGSVVSRLFKTAGVLLLLLGSVPAATGQPVDSLRVLWLGNSYTYSNDLPQLTADLAAAASKTLINDSNTPGGYTLAGHSTNATTLGLIAQGGWDYVVLQEQSQIPTIPYWREHSMYPAARLLDSLIVQNGAATMFFMTWGREFGGQQCIDDYCSPDFVDFFHMQDSLASAYRRWVKAGRWHGRRIPWRTSGPGITATPPWKDPTWPPVFSIMCCSARVRSASVIPAVCRSSWLNSTSRLPPGCWKRLSGTARRRPTSACRRSAPTRSIR